MDHDMNHRPVDYIFAAGGEHLVVFTQLVVVHLIHSVIVQVIYVPEN